MGFIIFFIVSASTKASAPPSPMPNNCAFSPGYHAQQLKLIKQSPGDGFYRTSRPMFDTAQGADPVGSLFENQW